MELKDFVRKKLGLNSESYYWDEWESALDHHDPSVGAGGMYEFCKGVWDARQSEIDTLKERNAFLEKTLQEMMV
jgi:hypothetical protein